VVKLLVVAADPNDDRFKGLAKRYMAARWGMELPSDGHYWRFEPGVGLCGEGTCEWDVINAYAVGPDGVKRWEGPVPDGFNESLSLSDFLAQLIGFEAAEAGETGV
jgi:hypothetical protein